LGNLSRPSNLPMSNVAASSLKQHPAQYYPIWLM